MGVGPNYKSSNGQTEIRAQAAEIFRLQEQLKRALEQDPRNPDPTRWHILQHEIVKQYLLVEILYPNCTNFEGRKLCLYDQGTTVMDLINQRVVDPHFSDTTALHPLARFEPTPLGWVLARKAAK